MAYQVRVGIRAKRMSTERRGGDGLAFADRRASGLAAFRRHDDWDSGLRRGSRQRLAPCRRVSPCLVGLATSLGRWHLPDQLAGLRAIR